MLQTNVRTRRQELTLLETNEYVLKLRIGKYQKLKQMLARLDAQTMKNEYVRSCSIFRQVLMPDLLLQSGTTAAPKSRQSNELR